MAKQEQPLKNTLGNFLSEEAKKRLLEKAQKNDEQEALKALEKDRRLAELLNKDFNDKTAKEIEEEAELLKDKKRKETREAIEVASKEAGPTLTYEQAKLLNLSRDLGYKWNENPVDENYKGDRENFKRALRIQRDIKNRLSGGVSELKQNEFGQVDEFRNNANVEDDGFVEEKPGNEHFDDGEFPDKEHSFSDRKIRRSAGEDLNGGYRKFEKRPTREKRNRGDKNVDGEINIEQKSLKKLSQEEVLYNIERISDVMLKGELLEPEDAPFWNEYTDLIDKRFGEKLSEKIDNFAKYQVYNNQPKTTESINFFEKYKDEILKRAEFFRAEKQKRWNDLSEKEKLDFIVYKIKKGNDVWLPWELEFQRNNSELIENKLKEGVKNEVSIESEKPKKDLIEDGFEAARRRIHSGIDERFEEIKRRNQERDLLVDKKLGIEKEKPVEVLEKKPEILENKKVDSEAVKEIMERMNLTVEDLEKRSQNFFSLDEGKQIYVLDKLRQKINLDASLLAEEKVNEVLNKKTKFLSKDWRKKIKYKWTKEFQQDKTKKGIIKEIKDSSLLGYEKDLETLTNHVKDFAFPISYIDGQLIIEYENLDTFKNSKDLKEKFGKRFDPESLVEEFNLSATALSEIPYEWTIPQATFEQKKVYKKLLEEYQNKKNILSIAKKEQLFDLLPPDKVDDAFKLWSDSLDSSLKLNRVLTSHPEIADWQEDPKLRPGLSKTTNFFANLSNWSKGSGAAVLGAGARWLTRKSLAYGAGVVVVGAIGGYLGWRKKALEYDEKERKNRYGADIEDKGIKKYVEAGQAIKRIEQFIEMLDLSEGNDEKIVAIARRLKNHLFVLGQRLDDGRVNFGDKENRLINMTRLEQVIYEANSKLFLLGEYSQDSDASAELLGRFNRFIKDKVASNNKLKAKSLAALKGALVASGGYTLGYAIKDVFALTGSPQTVSGRINELVNEGGNGPQDDVVPGRLPSNPPQEIKQSVNLGGGNDVAPPKELNSDAVKESVRVRVTPEEDTTNMKGETTPKAEISDAKENLVPEKTDAEKLLEKLKNNVREISDSKEDLYKLEIKNKSFIKDVLDFDKNPEKYLVPGAEGDIKLSEDEAREYLAWKKTRELYPEGSEQQKWINKEMQRLGEVIRSKSGNIFEPYESVAPKIEDLDDLPRDIKDFDLNTEQSVKESVVEDTNNIRTGPSNVGPNSNFEVNVKEAVKEGSIDISPETAQEIKTNLSITKDVNGEIIDINIKNPSKVEDIVRFRKNAGNFLVEDMSKTQLPENMQTRSWGIWSLTKSREDIEKFLFLKEASKAFPENSTEHNWMNREMIRLGESIREKSGNIFAPYEQIAKEIPEVDISKNVVENVVSKAEIKDFDLMQNSVTENVSSTPENTVPEIKNEIKDFDLNQKEAVGSSPDVKLNTPEARMEALEVDDAVVSKSVEKGNLVLDFDSKGINGEITFVQKDGEIVSLEESNNFRTEEGVSFRKNPTKYISKNDIERVVQGLKKDGIKANEKFVMDSFERFINYREVINESGMPFSSEESVYIQNEMRKIDALFDKYTNATVIERINLIENGKNIDSLNNVQEVVSEKMLGDIGQNSKIFKTLVSKYGEGKIDGPIAKFKNGFVGFYSESKDEKVAIKLARDLAKSNTNLINGVIQKPADQMMTKMPDGTYRYFLIYKEANK